MKHKSVRGFTTKELVVTGLILLLIALPLYDAVYNSPYKARALSCKSSLKQIGQAITIYSNMHNGKVPPDFHTLIAALGSRMALVCPLSGYTALPSYQDRSYTCRFPTQPDSSQALCWDSGPHHPAHTVFLFLNRDNRNVLYADGKIVTLSEEQFQRLNLRGRSIIISQQ